MGGDENDVRSDDAPRAVSESHNEITHHTSTTFTHRDDSLVTHWAD